VISVEVDWPQLRFRRHVAIGDEREGAGDRAGDRATSSSRATGRGRGRLDQGRAELSLIRRRRRPGSGSALRTRSSAARRDAADRHAIRATDHDHSSETTPARSEYVMEEAGRDSRVALRPCRVQQRPSLGAGTWEGDRAAIADSGIPVVSGRQDRVRDQGLEKPVRCGRRGSTRAASTARLERRLALSTRHRLRRFGRLSIS